MQAQAARFTDTAALFQAMGAGWWNRGDVAATTGPQTRCSSISYLDRFPDTVQQDHIDSGMRLSALCGENSVRRPVHEFNKNNSVNGRDFPMVYAETSAAIALILGLCNCTVDFHIDSARAKPGVATRIEA